MLGIGAGGTILALFPKLRDLSNIGLYTFSLGVDVSVSHGGCICQ